MKIEQQVCTLEQAKRLVQLGVYAPSAFLYFKATSHSGIVLGETYIRQIWIVTGVAYGDEEINITPAYTVAELGVMLGEEKAMVIENVDKTEAESRAAHLIWLLEGRYLSAEEVNQRLNA